MELPIEMKDHPCMSGGACQCGGSCGGCGRQAAAKPRLGSLDAYRVAYPKNENLYGDIDRWRKEYPYYSDLSLIAERDEEGVPLRIGNGRGEIMGRLAGALARLGYVDIQSGHVAITDKGEQYIDRSLAAFDRL